MSSLSIRIDRELKEQMNKFKIDWPKYIRKTIEHKIIEEKRRQAACSMDAIRSKTKYGIFDTTLSIREDRNT